MSARSYRDARGRPLVAVTGIGVVSSLGQGQAETWAAMIAGRSGIHAIDAVPDRGPAHAHRRDGGFPRHRAAGRPAPVGALRRGGGRGGCRAGRASARRGTFRGRCSSRSRRSRWNGRSGRPWPRPRAATDRSITPGCSGPLRRGGSMPWHDLFIFGTVADRIADRFGTKGSPISLSTACSSGATAIQLGVEAIRRGETAAALCIGTDGSVNPESLIRFSLLSALSTRNDEPERGLEAVLEGSGRLRDGRGRRRAGPGGFRGSAVARGATILGYVLGCGEKGDGFHRTRSSPDGAPIIAAIRASLDDAGLDADAIDTVNAHGTSTPENDKMEALGLGAVFGDRTGAVPVTSNKSMIGHTLTAAGAIEAAVSLLTIRHGRVPPTINHRVPDPDDRPRRGRDRPRSAGADRAVELVRVRRPEHLPGLRRGARVSAATAGRRVLVTGGASGIGAAIVRSAWPAPVTRSTSPIRASADAAQALLEEMRAAHPDRALAAHALDLADKGALDALLRDRGGGRLLRPCPQCRPVLRCAGGDARPGAGRGGDAGQLLLADPPRQGAGPRDDPRRAPAASWRSDRLRPSGPTPATPPMRRPRAR